MKLFNHFSKRAKLLSLGALIALAAVTAFALAPATSIAGPGPNRPTKVYSNGVAGFDYPTFDSFTNVPGIGNEENFFNGKYPTTGSVYSDPMPEVKDGDVLTLEVYVHNGADPSLNASGTGIAKNTQVRVALPSGVAKNQEATAYISADNAQPKTVTDTLDFGAANGGAFSLEYVKGSAHIQGNYINASLPDSVVTSGATIGTDALDGQMKGCFQQMVYVTLQVKVNMPEYSLTKQVSVKGKTSTWAKSDNVVAGDTADWMLTFKNNGETPLNSVAIADQVPAGLTVVPGSIKLTNGNYPNGYTFPDSAVIDNGRTISINIGNYNPGILAYITYQTTVNKPGADVCSPETLTNKAFATPSGFGAIWDTASVTVPGNSCQQTPVYSCNLLTLSQSGRTVNASVDYSAQNGVSLKTVTYNFGNGANSVITTDKTTQSYTYPSVGTYHVTATLTFNVNGADVTGITSQSCAQPVSFTTPTTPTALPNTGTGDTIGVVIGAIVAGTVAGRLFLSRKLARR
jgi:uncharacterized repeat protein (TIGR01451 family)/LPXTG-motif cell wall-anchored protein